MKKNIYDKKIASQIRRLQNKLENATLRPIFVQWMATYECNLNCGYCGSSAGIARDDELNTGEMMRLVNDLAELKCKYLSISGGEPLVRKDLFKVINYARGRDIEVGIVTNGYLVEDYLLSLRKAKLYAISISIDGYRKKHDKIRNMAGLYEKCLRSLLICDNLKIPSIQVSTVIGENNISELEKITEEIFKYGCIKHRIQLLVPEGRAKNKETPPWVIKKALKKVYRMRKNGYNIFIADNFGYIGNLERELRPYNFFCGCGWFTFTIMPNGDIMGCPVYDYPELKEGNVRERRITDIWWNAFHKFRQFNISDLPEMCRECQYCKVCRGGCWVERINGGEFCNLDLVKELVKELKIEK